MGFSPGDFNCMINGSVHWELKSGNRIVLWDEYEKRMLLDLRGVDAEKASTWLRLLTDMFEEEP